MPFRIKLAITGLIISLTVIASIANSDALYNFYLQKWHKDFRGETAGQALLTAGDMRRSFEKKREKIANRAARLDFESDFDHDFTQYLSTMVRVFAPDSVLPEELTGDERELCRYLGLWYLEKGDTIKGCRCILRTVDKVVSRDEIVPFTRALESMYQAKMYSDIIIETSQRSFDAADERYPLRVTVYLWYGVSLYNQKHYREALGQLRSAENAGLGDGDLHYYISQCFYAMKQPKEAIPYAEKALASSPRDRKYRALLVTLYNADGRRKDAERASRGF